MLRLDNSVKTLPQTQGNRLATPQRKVNGNFSRSVASQMLFTYLSLKKFLACGFPAQRPPKFTKCVSPGN